MEITVFYAWQSDRDKKVNRYLIQEAAEKALKRITDDASIDVSLRLDYDTKDVPGMPEITATILKKIEKSNIFLADLTFVAIREAAESGEKSKYVPNPNVLFELGYAFKSLGSETIICVMNTAYGDADLQIFDLAHRRWPIRYQLKPEDQANKAEVRKSLSVEIEGAVRSILKEGLPTRPQIDPSFNADRAKFEQELINGTFSNLQSSQGVLGIIVVPEMPIENIDFMGFRGDLTQHLTPIGGGSYNSRPYGDYFQTWESSPDQTNPVSVTRIYSSGKILSASSKFIAPHMGYDFQQPWRINDWMITRTPIEYIFRYLKLMEKIGKSGHYYISISLLNLPRCDLLVGLRQPIESGETFREGRILPPPLKINISKLGSAWPEFASRLRQTLDYIWREFGFSRCLYYDSTGNWVGDK